MANTIFESRARKFVDNIDTVDHKYDEMRFRNRLREEIGMFTTKKDKLDHMRNIEEFIKLDKAEHEESCNEEGCQTSPIYEKCLFFVAQEITLLIDSTSDQRRSGKQESATFTSEEKEKLFSLIDEVLTELKYQGLGQEIIYDEFESLKADANRVTKKDLRLMVVGKLGEYGVGKLFHVPAIQDLYKFLVDGVKELPIFK